MKRAIDATIAPFWKETHHLTVKGDLMLYNQRIVVPESLRKETLLRIHEGHQGIERCRMRGKTSVWWPGMGSHISLT